MSSSISTLNRKARQASHEGRGWLEPTARLGLICKGLTYIIVGGIGLGAVFGAARAMGPREALTVFVSHFAGALLLPLIGSGLWAYAMWRFLQAICDPEHRGTGWKAICLRLGFLANGLIHLSMGWTAFGLVIGSDRGHKEFEEDWTARALVQPWGDYLVGAVALAIAVGGVYQISRAWKGKFQKRWKVPKDAQETKHWARYMGQIGLTSRGVIFLVIAWLLLQAAVHLNATEAGGVGDALQMLGSLKYGAWLLGGVSVGLLAYGVFAFIEAYYREIWSSAGRR